MQSLSSSNRLPLAPSLPDPTPVPRPARCRGALALFSRGDAPLLPLRIGATGEHLVEDVEVALALGLEGKARLLQQVRVDVGAVCQVLLAIFLEDDADVLAEAGGVVIALRLAVAERLEDRVRLQNPLVEPEARLRPAAGRGALGV